MTTHLCLDREQLDHLVMVAEGLWDIIAAPVMVEHLAQRWCGCATVTPTQVENMRQRLESVATQFQLDQLRGEVAKRQRIETAS